MESERGAAVSLGEREGRRVIILEGAVDIFFAADLRQAALGLLGAGEDVAVCCEKLERLDTAALQILLALKKELEQNGKTLQVIDLPAGPARLVDLAGLTGRLL